MLLVSELQREAETPPRRESALRLLRRVCHSVVSCLFKADPRAPSPTPLPPYHRHRPSLLTARRGATPINLLNDRSVSFSSVYESIPPPRSPSSPSLLSVLPGNRRTGACKQKPNRLSSWLLMSFGRVRSRQVLRLAAERNGTQTNRHASKQRQPPAFLTSARYFALTDGC